MRARAVLTPAALALLAGCASAPRMAAPAAAPPGMQYLYGSAEGAAVEVQA